MLNGVRMVRPQASSGAAVEHYAGIDVSLTESSVCVVDGNGKIVREVKVASAPETLCELIARYWRFAEPDRDGSGSVIAMAAERAGRCRL